MTEYTKAKNALMDCLRKKGFPDAFGEEIAKNLGGLRAILRMCSYLERSGPISAEEIVDEMLCIREEIQTWRAKKAKERANAVYNDVLWNGLNPDGDESEG